MWQGRTVSVALPTYNERESIRACIDGFFATGDIAVMNGRQINETVGLGLTYHQVVQVWHKIGGKWMLEYQQSTRLPKDETA